MRVVLSKNGGMFREIVRFFMGKKIVTYPVVIHCILYSLRIRLFTRICMRHKLITIVPDKNKRLFTQMFFQSFHFDYSLLSLISGMDMLKIVKQNCTWCKISC